MKRIVSTVSAAAVALCCLLAMAARAGDLSFAGGAQTTSKVDQEINQAVGQNGSSSSADLDTQVKDLEATRTEINQKRPPTVSLGVSGWVTEQVQFNGKQ